MPRRPHRLDEGVTLIEVMVSLLVFAILATGIVAATGTIVRMTGDDRARATAANLASQELDIARAIGDPFSVTAATTVTGVDGRNYTVNRTVSWISNSGTDVSCSSGTNLFYLRVNVRVTWPGMLGTTSAVQDDTVLAPTARINDGSTGSIAVTVSGADASPQSGVTVTITPKSGGTGKALTTQPKATGADGCSYANQLTPGVYTVALSRTGSISDFALPTPQSATPTKDVTVTAGTTQSVPFQYDLAGTLTTNYVSGPLTYSGAYGTMNKPVAFETNFTNTYGTYTTTSPAASVKLFPYSSGYAAFTGPGATGSPGCASIDPAAWTAASPLGTGVRATAAAGAGGTAVLSIPMGVVLVKAPANYYLGATQATATGAGNPGCGVTGTVYTYSVVTTGSWVPVALPYGSWKIYYGTTQSNALPVAAANLQVVTNTLGGGVASDGTVTLDPRK